MSLPGCAARDFPSIIHYRSADEATTQCGLPTDDEGWTFFMVDAVEITRTMVRNMHRPSDGQPLPRHCQGCAERMYKRVQNGVDAGPILS